MTVMDARLKVGILRVSKDLSSQSITTAFLLSYWDPYTFIVVSPIMTRLTDRQKWQIVLRFERCQNMAQVAREVGHSKRAVKRWVVRHKLLNSVAVAKGQGRKRSMAPEAARLAGQMLVSRSYHKTQQVAQQLHTQGHTSTLLHSTTVARHAKTVAASMGEPIKVLRGMPKKMLSPSSRSERLAFSLANADKVWGNTMFTDRKKFLFKYPRHLSHQLLMR